MLWADDNENEGLKDSIMWNKSSIQGACMWGIEILSGWYYFRKLASRATEIRNSCGRFV